MLDQISTFFAHNYLWLIFIGIVLVMALIGYIADKKSLIKTSSVKIKKSDAPISQEDPIKEPIVESKKEENKSKKEKDIKDIKSLEHISLGDELTQAPIVEEIKIEEPLIEAPSFEDIQVPSPSATPVVEKTENLKSEKPKEVAATTVENIPQELFQPMGALSFDNNKEDAKEEVDIWQI